VHRGYYPQSLAYKVGSTSLYERRQRDRAALGAEVEHSVAGALLLVCGNYGDAQEVPGFALPKLEGCLP